MEKPIENTLQKKEVAKTLQDYLNPYDPSVVLKESGKEIQQQGGKSFTLDPKSNTFKALTLSEFENGMLMSFSVPEHNKTFVIDYSRKLQEEFQCKAVAEKSLCELTAINYVRSLEVQRKINNLLNQNGLTKLDVQYLAILSKELDRAQRHYLSGLQTLRTFKQPVLQLNVRANTAVVGQNQLVQSNNHE